MKIETPGSTNLVLPITQKNKTGHSFPLQEVEFKGPYTQRILQFCAWQKGKDRWMCWHRCGVLCAHTKFENCMNVLMFG